MEGSDLGLAGKTDVVPEKRAGCSQLDAEGELKISDTWRNLREQFRHVDFGEGDVTFALRFL